MSRTHVRTPHERFNPHGTTILAVRRNGAIAMGGDGQVTLGNTVMKGNARKVRRLYNDKVLARLRRRHGRCLHAVRALRRQAREVRQPHARRHRAREGLALGPLPAAPRSAAAGGRPGEAVRDLRQRRCDRARATRSRPSAPAARSRSPRRARSCEDSDLDARSIVEKSLDIAADICIYTNRNLVIDELK